MSMLISLFSVSHFGISTKIIYNYSVMDFIANPWPYVAFCKNISQKFHKDTGQEMLTLKFVYLGTAVI